MDHDTELRSFLFCAENFKDLFSLQFSNMQHGVITIVTMLYIIFPWPIHFISRILYLLTPFTYFGAMCFNFASILLFECS